MKNYLLIALAALSTVCNATHNSSIPDTADAAYEYFCENIRNFGFPKQDDRVSANSKDGWYAESTNDSTKIKREGLDKIFRIPHKPKLEYKTDSVFLAMMSCIVTPGNFQHELVLVNVINKTFHKFDVELNQKEENNYTAEIIARNTNSGVDSVNAWISGMRNTYAVTVHVLPM